jgi:hypothetical protein
MTARVDDVFVIGPGGLLRPGKIVDATIGGNQVCISWLPEGQVKARVDWFHSLVSQRRPGYRMGDHTEDALRYEPVSLLNPPPK